MKNKKIIIGVVIAAIAIVGIILAVVLGGNKYPNDVASLQKAIENKAAINCEVVHASEYGDRSMTIQANKNWDNVKTITKMDGGDEINSLVIKDDAGYMWFADTAYKEDYDSNIMENYSIDLGIDGEDYAEADRNITISCTSPSKNNFSVPDKEWIDASSYTSEEYDDSESIDDVEAVETEE